MITIRLIEAYCEKNNVGLYSEGIEYLHEKTEETAALQEKWM
jgi:hypothetical protein